jgi:hypothetical protein
LVNSDVLDHNGLLILVQDRNFEKLLGKLESTHAHRNLEQKLVY